MADCLHCGGRDTLALYRRGGVRIVGCRSCQCEWYEGDETQGGATRPSALGCQHANEAPATRPCDCPPRCYCKTAIADGGSEMCSSRIHPKPPAVCERCAQLDRRLVDEGEARDRAERDLAATRIDRAAFDALHAELARVTRELEQARARLAELEPKPEPPTVRIQLEVD